MLFISALGSSKGDRSISGGGLGGDLTFVRKDIGGPDIEALARLMVGDSGGDKGLEYFEFPVGDVILDGDDSERARIFRPITDKRSFFGGGGGGFDLCVGDRDGDDTADFNDGGNKDGGSVAGTGTPACLCLIKCITMANSSDVNLLSLLISARILV